MATATDGYVTDVSYIPGFYPHLAPVAMRYAAALNRVAPPRTAAGFRYLELGCGLGRSLTTLARNRLSAPSSHCGKRWNRCCATTMLSTASPRNSRRSLLRPDALR